MTDPILICLIVAALAFAFGYAIARVTAREIVEDMQDQLHIMQRELDAVECRRK